MQAARLLRQGLSQSAVARQVGVHRQSVSRCDNQLAEGGTASLKKAGRAGRKPRLSPADLRRVGTWAEAWSGSAGLRHRAVDGPLGGKADRAGVRGLLHSGHVWRILRDLGWSVQRPTGQALERDEQAIQHWKEKRWPAPKGTQRGKGESSSS